MKMYQARFILETMAVLFEQRRRMVDMLDDMASRMEELEVELEDIMTSEGYDVNNKQYAHGWWDSPAFKPGLDADGASDCGCKTDPSYRMD